MTFTLNRGKSALLVSMPHVGTDIPADLRHVFVPRALGVEDTDWHLPSLYDFVADFDATVLTPRYSRYVIDLNRPPDDAPMYPGAANTELCPTRFFTGEPLYEEGKGPDANERLRRRELYWRPYHEALAAELERIKAMHGYVLLWDAHSIRSRIPWLFDGTLPGLNIGTAHGASADASIAHAIDATCKDARAATHVMNGRFTGGYITRHYGSPANHVHAVQLEMCQNLYMRESLPFDYDQRKASEIQALIKMMMESAQFACARLYRR